MKRKTGIIFLAIVALISLWFYWGETQETIKLREQADARQATIVDQQSEYNRSIIDHAVELGWLNEMLQQQSDTIRQLDDVLEQAVITTTILEAEIASYNSIAGWTYKPWESKRELREWLTQNNVSEREFSDDYDCDDFAYDLFRAALEDGRIIGIMREDRHRFNFADVGNVIYQIEPQNDKVTKTGRVD